MKKIINKVLLLSMLHIQIFSMEDYLMAGLKNMGFITDATLENYQNDRDIEESLSDSYWLYRRNFVYQYFCMTPEENFLQEIEDLGFVKSIYEYRITEESKKDFEFMQALNRADDTEETQQAYRLNLIKFVREHANGSTLELGQLRNIGSSYILLKNIQKSNKFVITNLKTKAYFDKLPPALKKAFLDSGYVKIDLKKNN